MSSPVASASAFSSLSRICELVNRFEGVCRGRRNIREVVVSTNRPRPSQRAQAVHVNYNRTHPATGPLQTYEHEIFKHSGHHHGGRTGCQHWEMIDSMAAGVPVGNAGRILSSMALYIPNGAIEFCPGV